MRIAIAGFQHETNTFSPRPTTLADFERADSWPQLLRSGAVLAGTRGINLPVAGFAAEAGRAGVTLAPLLWCAAEPGGRVTDAAFERIAAEIVEGLARAGPIDGIYLDLHGAMVTESHEDGEGELLSRIRGALGPVPLVASLDLHANISPQMVEAADALAIFRTYPHLDMAETGARCLPILARLADGHPVAKAFRQAPFLVPLHAQHTGAEPCRTLHALAQAERAELALGFTAADVPDCGPSVVAYADTRAAAAAAADRVMDGLAAAEGAVARAMALSAQGPGPVIIADVQDNPGAGAGSDSTGLLRALVEGGAERAVLGLLADPEMARRARAAGPGADIAGPLGGRSGVPGDQPFEGRFRVERIGPGRCRFTGAMYRGSEAVLGDTAVLRVAGTDVRIVVTAQRSQCLDRALFEHLGVMPREMRIVALKSTVHFRADFEPIARAVLVAEAAGGFACRPDRLCYHRLRTGLRRMPGARPP